MIGTRPDSKLSIDRSAASTFVAFESLTNLTPSDLGHQLHGVLEAAKPIDGRRHRRGRHAGDGADRRGRHHVVDQMRPEQMDRIERHQPYGCVGRSAWRSTIQPSSSAVPSAIGACRPKRRWRARPFRASSRTAGSSALITAQSLGRLVLENPGLRRAVRLDVRMAIEMVRREIQHHRDPGMERLDLLELKAAGFDHVQRCPASSRTPAR